MIPGEIISKNDMIILNAGKETSKVSVINASDRPIQIGSHFHFFEVNKALKFDREKAYGKRLNIPSGTSTRFEPGEEKLVELVVCGGSKRFIGLNNLVDDVADDTTLEKSMENAKAKKFV